MSDDDFTAAPVKRAKTEQPTRDVRMTCNLRLVIGPPKAGKSVLIKDLICRGAERGDWDFILILCKTKHNGDYDFILNQDMVISNPDKFDEKIKALLLKMARIKNEQKQNQDPDTPPPKPVKALLVFDDPLGNVTFNSSLVTDLCSNYRQYHLDVIIASQYIAKLPLHFYTMCSMAYVFRWKQQEDIKKVFERLISGQDSAIKKIIDLQTSFKELSPNEFLLINNNSDAIHPVGKAKARSPAELSEEQVDF